ncbi:MAG: PAS domain S-box protein [Candidatus Methanoperedens sp.]|nr:PAS domain S-box protein [Candidatus Methanoperedens sp.]
MNRKIGDLKIAQVIGKDMDRAEETLRESEERYRNLFENMQEGFAYCRMFFENGEPYDFIYLDVNEAFERLTGLKNVVGKKVTEVIPGIKESNPELFKIYGKVALTGQPERFETYLESIGIWFLISVYGVQKEHFVAVFDNITERKQAEEALRDSESKYRKLHESMMDGFVFVDMEGKIKEYNRSYQNILGYGSEELTSLNYEDITPKKWHSFEQKILETQILQNGYSEVYEKEYCKKDGTIFPVELRTFLIKNEKGENIGMWAIVRDITERKKAEEQIIQQREFLNSIFESLTHPFYVIDANDYSILMANSAARLGKLTESSKCHALTHMLDKPCSGEHICPLEEVKITKKPATVEHIHYDKDGNARNVEVHGFPILDKKGNVIKMIEYSLDITKRKRAEEELRKVNRAYRTLSQCNQTLIRATNEPELLYEICKRIVEAGGYPLAWIGIAEEDEEKTIRLVAQAGYDEVSPETPGMTWADNERGRGHIGTAIRTGKASVVKNIETDPNYAPWLDEAIKRSYNSAIALPLVANGKPFGVLNICAKEQDAFDSEEITLLNELAGDIAYGIMSLRTRDEHKRAENRLLFQGQIIENISEGVYLIRADDGIIVYANPKFEKMFGYEKDELIGKPVSVVNAPTEKSPEETAKEISKVLDNNGEWSGEVQNIKKDGTKFWCSAHVSTFERSEYGKVWISIHTDITERKKAEEIRIENLRLESADKAKSEFLANMSHELRTPLNASIGFSELLKMGLTGELSDKQKHYVDNILTSNQFLLTLINDILDLSRIEAGKIELVPDKMSVPEIIKETLSLIKEKAMKHKVLLKTEFDPELEFIEADKQRFKQILFNLLSNAVKFSKDEGGTLTITAKKEGEMAQISVSDTGIGIKEENIGRLFHKFEQLEKGISEKYGGTGLGLDITKHLVELHGGRIWVESRYGEGSTFTFLLPIEVKKGVKIEDN